MRRALGIVVIVAGVVVAIALWFGAGRRYDDAVAELAPAPIGCDTTLVFDRAGRYTFFVETKGHVEEIDGDCQSSARDYDVTRAPHVALTLVDSDGGPVDLERTSGPSYDRDGRRGDGVRAVQIDDAGSYVLTATAGDTDAVIRVGRDPARGVGALRVGAMVALLVGLVAGVLLLVLGQRRPTAAPAALPAPPWPTRFPTSPPLAPPAANPPVPPPYGPRPPAGSPAPGPQTPAGPPESTRPPGGWPGGGSPLPPPPPPGRRAPSPPPPGA